MDHRQYIEQYMSADVDEELSPAERQVVTAHLAGCADCRQRQADERALKALLRERIPLIPAPAELRQKIIAGLDLEDAHPAIRRTRFARRPLLLGSIGALAAAAAVLVVILVGGLGRQPIANSALEVAVSDYLKAERNFASNPALSSQTDLAAALATELGYPFVWDFSALGLALAGARIDRQPSGKVIVYSFYKGKAGSILCINFRQHDFVMPPGGEDVHGVRFYHYKDVWVGVVSYASVFCYFVSRLTPAQMMPALIHGGPSLGA